MKGSVFEIHQLGHPILRQTAKVVKDIHNLAFQQNLDALMSFVLEKGGMGIAAPQIGISEQFFILSSHPNQRYPKAPKLEPFFVINPEIIYHSEQLEKDWEGCLSLPGIRGLVPRHKMIQVQFYNRDGERVEKSYEGFIARVFQHEFDHLQGNVFIDHVESTKEIMMEQEWQKRIHHSS